MPSGVFVVSDRTAEITKALEKSVQQAVKKACFDTEAEAKKQVTIKNAQDTTAMKASIYANVGGKSGYTAAVTKAKSEAQKGSKHLRRSGKARPKQFKALPEVKPNGNTPGIVEGVVSVAAEYAIYVEMGTHRMPARPFMLPAEEKVAPQFVEVCKALFDQEVR